jgi:hypothetical protein
VLIFGDIAGSIQFVGVPKSFTLNRFIVSQNVIKQLASCAIRRLGEIRSVIEDHAAKKSKFHPKIDF